VTKSFTYIDLENLLGCTYIHTYESNAIAALQIGNNFGDLIHLSTKVTRPHSVVVFHMVYFHTKPNTFGIHILEGLGFGLSDIF
jgi:hypothetical protein